VESPKSFPSAFVDSLRSLGEGILGSIQSRFELIAVELQEGKCRLVQNLILVAIALFAGSMAALFASLTLVCAFWESGRLQVLGALTLFYTISSVATAIWVRRRFLAEPRLFSASLLEIEKDRICIRTDS
jgi:uncharacterized membrane protein YqjE